MKNKSNEELLEEYSKILDTLIHRKVLRTRNNPVADYAEYLVKERMKCKLEPNSKSGYDAVDPKGKKIQIKSRRWNDKRQSRHLGIIWNLDEHKFDYLIAIFFDNEFNVKEAYKMNHNTIVKHAKNNDHQHGHIIILNNKVLKDKNIIDIKNKFQK